MTAEDKKKSALHITVCSRKEAIQKAASLEQPTAIISISAPGNMAAFPKNPNITRIFYMEFFDKDDEDDPEYSPPAQKDFCGLKEFIDTLDCNELIIHCIAGVSRSPAVAAAVSEYLNMPHDFFNNKLFCPNRLVYKYASIELGIAEIKDKEYYQKIFAEDD